MSNPKEANNCSEPYTHTHTHVTGNLLVLMSRDVRKSSSADWSQGTSSKKRGEAWRRMNVGVFSSSLRNEAVSPCPPTVEKRQAREFWVRVEVERVWYTRENHYGRGGKHDLHHDDYRLSSLPSSLSLSLPLLQSGYARRVSYNTGGDTPGCLR